MLWFKDGDERISLMEVSISMSKILKKKDTEGMYQK